jgi:PAS domain S-box-containing protein
MSMIRVQRGQTKRSLPRYWPIVAVFVAMTVLQASVAVFSIQMLSTVRAYVTGESLYSKGQKDAQISLLAYAEEHREADYVRFMASLANPLGDRAAREALQLPRPNIAAARQGFLDGGNHPDDIDGLILMFRLFQHVPFMSRPIATWTEGDRTIEEMRASVDKARAKILAGDPQSTTVDEMRLKAPALNERLTRLTSLFSFQLGEASRTTQQLLLALNSFIAVLLTISGLVFVRRSARLQASAELRMERLIDAVTDGVVTVDDQRKVVLFNRAAETLFGVEATAALGNPIDRFVIDADGEALRLEPTSGPLQELVGKRHDDREFPAEASLSRLETDGAVLTTVVLRDVTARRTADAERRTHEALEASNRAKTEFLSRMSHELRTPLNAVIGFSKLLRIDTEKPLSMAQLERVQHVENAGAHLLALVNDVLDLSRIESGEMSVSTEAVQLSRVVEEAATMVSPLVTDAGIEVFLSAAVPSADTGRGSEAIATAQPHDVWVKADAVRLRQVLVNLLSNAVKYNRPGGSVSLTWQVSESECKVRVVDTGRGIPAGRLESLFEPFNRLGAETSSVEGTGIGLVLSRQLAEMMGGALEISSVFGEGTCASLTLLIATPPAVRAEAAHTHRPTARNGRPLRVLYAEDNEVNAELVRQIVRLRRAVSLRVAMNGNLALDMARIDPPDLMLVDMNLGDMTGIELARELQRDRSTRDIRLVALSADALPEQIRAALGAGFESYLTKPIVFEELLAMLDKHSQEVFA